MSRRLRIDYQVSAQARFSSINSFCATITQSVFPCYDVSIHNVTLFTANKSSSHTHTFLCSFSVTKNRVQMIS